MKLAITTMMWQRPEVFHIWAENILYLIITNPKYEYVVTVAGSEGEKSKKMVEDYGFKYLEFPNVPLGAKANARLQFTRQFNPDYVLFVGSDDIFTLPTFKYLLKCMEEDFDEIASLDLYYYWRGCIIYSHGYQGKRKGEPVAPGRILKASVLNEFDWKMWEPREQDYLDGHIRDRLESMNLKRNYFRHRLNGLCMLDIKTDVNMTQFQMRDNYEVANIKILQGFTNHEQQMLSEICVESLRH